MTANEIRQAIGMKPHEDPKADMLLNSNMPQPGLGLPDQSGAAIDEVDQTMNDMLDGLSADIDKIAGGAGG